MEGKEQPIKFSDTVHLMEKQESAEDKSVSQEMEPGVAAEETDITRTDDIQFIQHDEAKTTFDATKPFISVGNQNCSLPESSKKRLLMLVTSPPTITIPMSASGEECVESTLPGETSRDLSQADFFTVSQQSVSPVKKPDTVSLQKGKLQKSKRKLSTEHEATEMKDELYEVSISKLKKKGPSFRLASTVAPANLKLRTCFDAKETKAELLEPTAGCSSDSVAMEWQQTSLFEERKGKNLNKTGLERIKMQRQLRKKILMRMAASKAAQPVSPDVDKFKQEKDIHTTETIIDPGGNGNMPRLDILLRGSSEYTHH